MSDFRVASRYAKSLISLAESQGMLEVVHEDMQLFSQICESNRDFTLMLKNPIINHHKKLSILKGIFENRVNTITMSFFEIITRKNRENVLVSIATVFHAQYNQFKGIEMAKVSTMFTLDEPLRDQFKKIIKEATGKHNVELAEEVDKELIGGYILKVEGQQVDESLKGKIKELKLKFLHNPYIKGF